MIMRWYITLRFNKGTFHHFGFDFVSALLSLFVIRILLLIFVLLDKYSKHGSIEKIKFNFVNEQYQTLKKFLVFIRDICKVLLSKAVTGPFAH